MTYVGLFIAGVLVGWGWLVLLYWLGARDIDRRFKPLDRDAA